MTAEQLLRFAFVLYCAMVGIVLLLAPWTAGWDRIVTTLPFPGLRMLETPLARGALSGFGLIHLVWGIHDLSDFLRPPNEYPTPGDQ